jgi:valyl-tRNA synthetase
MMLAAPAGNDILFDESLCEQGRNFNNKIWNALRLVKGWQVADIEQAESSKIAIDWFNAQLSATIDELNDDFDKYRLSEALMTVYKLFWDEFSSWYLELVKPAYQQPIDAATYAATLAFFEKLTLLLHPFMPFITEEIWQALADRKSGDSIMVAQMPTADYKNGDLLRDFELVKELIAGVRSVRLERNIPNKDALTLRVASGEHNDAYNSVIAKLCNLEAIERGDKDATSASFMVRTTEYAVPLGNMINADEEIAKMETEIGYLQGFLKSVMVKLSNERFVANAKPEVVENERKKQADAESKIQTLQESIQQLKG